MKIPNNKIANGDFKRYHEPLKEIMSEFVRPGVYLGDFGYKDYSQIYELEEIAIEYWWVTTCIRRLHKGGTLKVEYSEYRVVCDAEIEKLLSLYDSRDSDMSTLLGIVLSQDSSSGLLPCYNVYKERIPREMFKLFEVELDIANEFLPNIVWSTFDFKDFYVSNKFLEVEFFEYYKFNLKDFIYVCFLITYEHMGSTYKNTNNVLEMFKRAYRYFTDKNEFVEGLYEINLDLQKHGDEKYFFDSQITLEEINKIISYLTLDYENRNNLSLTTLGPKKMILELEEENYILIDYLPLPDIILKITYPLNLENDVEKQKGYIFEDYVIKELNKENIKLWECKKELKQEDGTSKEIDVSFIYKNILFVCECKSNKQSIVFNMIGDRKSLNYREDKNKSGLSQVDKKVDWLIKGSKPLNYKIPENVEYIVPILITPFLEYIWSLEDKLWLNNRTPRIIKCRELIDFVKEDSLSNLISKPYVKKYLHMSIL